MPLRPSCPATPHCCYCRCRCHPLRRASLPHYLTITHMSAWAFLQARPEYGMTKESYLDAVFQGIAGYYAASRRALGAVRVLWQCGAAALPTRLRLSPIQNADAAAAAASISCQQHVPVPSCSPPRPYPNKADIQVRLLLSIDRRQSTEEALDTARLAVRLKDEGVAGGHCVGMGACAIGNWRRLLKVPVGLPAGIDLSGNPSVGQVSSKGCRCGCCVCAGWASWGVEAVGVLMQRAVAGESSQAAIIRPLQVII